MNWADREEAITTANWGFVELIEEVFMPRWGITMKEGKIIKWLVAGGDRVTSGQAVCEVSTEKIVQSIESPLDGTVVKLLHPTGATVPVGQPILVVERSNRGV